MVNEQGSLFDTKQGAVGAVREGVSPNFPICGRARMCAHERVFAKVGHPTAPSAPSAPPDPADAYPTKASIKAAFDAWTAEGQPWPPPAGLTSAIASRLIPRRNCEARTWRK